MYGFAVGALWLVLVLGVFWLLWRPRDEFDVSLSLALLIPILLAAFRR